MALRWDIGGWVRNCGGTVEIEAEGNPETLSKFVRAIRTTPPKGSEI
ncbi:MAG: acylphosphatase [Planctomycetes bacterium]|nr:acylphosphatase [Planctomycetota bacterium]